MSTTRRVTPSFLLAMLEMRGLLEFAAFPMVLPFAKHCPAGEQQPVMVLPGFMANDNSTSIIRRWLTKLGYSSYGWAQGRNQGLTDKRFESLQRRVQRISRHHDQPVRLIGWSLGGIQARALAHEVSNNVERVITLGSPFRLPSAKQVGGSVSRVYRRLHGGNLDHLMNPQAVWQYPPPMPSTAVYSYTDGIASWDFCVDRLDGSQTENIGVPTSHGGLGGNPLVMLLLADRLAGNSDSWRRFDFSGWRRYFYCQTKGHRHPYPVSNEETVVPML